jgi:hypothetical protein
MSHDFALGALSAAAGSPLRLPQRGLPPVVGWVDSFIYGLVRPGCFAQVNAKFPESDGRR